MTKPLSEFSPWNRSKDGHASYCKKCKRKYAANARTKPGAKDAAVEYLRNYRNRNRERTREYNRNYWSRNVAKHRELTLRYRANKSRATPKWADFEAMLMFYEIAQECSRLTGLQFHVDHIVPLKSKLVCGLHNQFNLQILIGADNIRKGNRSWLDMPGELF